MVKRRYNLEGMSSTGRKNCWRKLLSEAGQLDLFILVKPHYVVCEMFCGQDDSDQWSRKVGNAEDNESVLHVGLIGAFGGVCSVTAGHFGLVQCHFVQKR